MQLIQRSAGRRRSWHDCVQDSDGQDHADAFRSNTIEGGFVHMPSEACWLAEYFMKWLRSLREKFDDQVDSVIELQAGSPAWAPCFCAIWSLTLAKAQSIVSKIFR
jgi:hypothetical protein